MEYYPSGEFTEAKYTLTLTKGSWGTVVLPFEPSSESISNLEFYSYEGVDDGKVFVSEATDIQAGVPYLVKNVSGKTTSFTLTATNPTITLTARSRNADGFTFKGCFRSSDVAANSNFYYMNGTVFQKATQYNVAPLHAYIVAPEVFEKESMGVEIWNSETVPVFVDGVIPTSTTTGKYGYWLDKSQNKFWTKFCARHITDDNELTVPVALNNEIWYTTTDNGQIEHKVDCKTNEYLYGLGKIVLTDGVTEIAKDAFNRNKTIQSIFIPSAVKKIGDSSFWGCDALKSVIFSSLPVVDQHAFGSCGSLFSKVLDLTDSDKPYIGTSTANYPGFTKARYHRTLEQGKWGTIVLPFKPASTEGLKFYALQSMTLRQAQGEPGNGGTLTFMKVDAPDAGIPYLFRNEGESADFTLTAEKPSIILETQEIGTTNFKMKGSFQQVSLNNTTDEQNDNLYYLKDNGFYHAKGKINIAPFRAYIEGSGAVQAKSFVLVVSDNGEDITAIPGILTDGSIDETEAIYDLNGRRLAAPVKGQVNIIRTKSGKTVKVNFANRAQ